jgi:Ni/Fe-hydrogenase 1 B-type cytochrome subunit
MKIPAPGAAAPPSEFRRVYVWEIPVRFYHWLNALCLLVLVLTGLIIAHPPALASASEASFSYWFGVNRFIHFVASYVFLANLVLRIYWGFVGNQYADWRNFIPLRTAQFREILQVLKVDLLQTGGQPVVAVGHNAMAYLTYFVLFWFSVLQVVTGFAMYASMSTSWFPQLFTWALPLFGSDHALREWHYLAMWFFILFTMVHVYLVFYHDYVEGHGVMSSMVGGWKFLHSEVLRPDGKARFSARGRSAPRPPVARTSSPP